MADVDRDLTPQTSHHAQSNKRESSADPLEPAYRAELMSPSGERYHDLLAEEAPLSLIVQGESYAVFMRTPGADQALIYGFLITERLIEDLDDVLTLVACDAQPQLRIHLTLEAGVRLPARSQRSFISSSCGLCSLSKLTIDTQEAKVTQMTDDPDWESRTLRRAELTEHLNAFNQLPSLFSLTGGAHMAALFDSYGEARYHQDDVGRHNAVDKVIGLAMLSGERSLSGWVLMVSSRASYEIIQKAVSAGVSALITLGAASGAAHRYALSKGLNLYSFVSPKRAHWHARLTTSPE